jgi:hypothetical protein
MRQTSGVSSAGAACVGSPVPSPRLRRRRWCVGVHRRPPGIPHRSCRFAAPLRHVVGFPDLGLLRGLRPISGSSVDDGPARHRPGWTAGRAIPRWFPRSPCTGRRGRCPALLRQSRHGYAAGLPRGLPTGIRNRLRSRRPTGGGRALLTGPYPPDWSRRRDYGAFPAGSNCVYTFPSRLPDPGRLVVSTRPGVVGAAPTLTCVPRLGLPPASKACCDRPTVESFHLHPVHGASWRTRTTRPNDNVALRARRSERHLVRVVGASRSPRLDRRAGERISAWFSAGSSLTGD